ncbi:hypothetical protein ABE65_016615 [Fictibacillus phosphorivorans]|uniref:Uncharacterized protein n=1 Tax=Fictibacillus phosphorivorans TaxID=1221500 RepID=A0A160IR30_9BACL|nr:hypothetical protein ABE65_016615 [Fictibacillus phosphorivorans]
MRACYLISFLQGMRRGIKLRKYQLVDAGARMLPRSGQVRPLRAHSGKGLTACPAESEHTETEISHFQGQLRNKLT